uniref:Uncharacterized protein n=1 Tax=Manihot esculenta TaxID=3983 RepID=A0A2C9UAU5_MANES
MHHQGDFNNDVQFSVRNSREPNIPEGLSGLPTRIPISTLIDAVGSVCLSLGQCFTCCVDDFSSSKTLHADFLSEERHL